jgi:raffinose/stachyose/melibiose transport system substrate-binding protein
MESQLSRGDFVRRGAGAALTVAAAGSLGLRVPAALGADAAGSYTYTSWSFDNSDSYKNTKAAFADASKMVKSAHVDFKMSNLSGSGAALYPSKIQSLIAAGQPPDTWESWGGSLAKPYLDAHAVLPLDPWFKKYGWNKKLSAAAITLISAGGHPYGVPFNVISIPMFYNRTLFAKAGVTPPKTYDEWEKANDALAKAGVQAYTQGGIYGWDVMRLFEHLLETTAGPTLHDQLLAFHTGWNKPQVVEAFALLKKWGDNWLPKGFIGMNPNDATLLFTSGKAAQNLEGGWIVDQIKGAGSNPEDYDYFVPPGDKGPARMAGFVQQYLVSNKLSGAKLDALGQFFNAFVSPAIQQKYLINGSTATKNGVPRNGEPLLAKYMKTTLTSKLYLIQDQVMSPKLANAYFALQSDVCKGAITPKAAAAKMDAAVKKYKK